LSSWDILIHKKITYESKKNKNVKGNRYNKSIIATHKIFNVRDGRYIDAICSSQKKNNEEIIGVMSGILSYILSYIKYLAFVTDATLIQLMYSG